MKPALRCSTALLILLSAGLLLGQGVNGPRGTIWNNDGTTGTGANLLAVSSGVDNTAVNAGSATTGIIGVCVSGCGTSGQSVIANWGDVPCSFGATATDGDFVQAAGSGSQCVDAGASVPTGGGAVLGIVKKGGSGAGVYLVSWSYSRPSSGGSGGGGGPSVTMVIPNLSMQTAVGAIPITGVAGCVSSTCTLTTAAADTTYTLRMTVTQTAPGAGCSTNGTLQLWVAWTDADSNSTLPGNTNLATINPAAVALSASMTMGNTANGGANMFNTFPLSIRLKNGTSFTFQVRQLGGTVGCSPQPTFTVRAYLYP